MDLILFKWLFNVIELMGSLGSWLLTPILFGLSPLAIFTLTGFPIFMSFMVIRFMFGWFK